MREPLSQAFKEKFGLDIDWVIGSPQALSTKIMAERRAGLYLADITMGGTSRQISVLKPAGVLEPLRPLLVLPEVVDEKAWYGGELPFKDKEKSYILDTLAAPIKYMTVNTSMVRPEEITSYNNLLEPRWKGQVALEDPTTGGQASRMFVRLLVIMGQDPWRKLAANNPGISGNERILAEWIARGRYPILLGGRAEIIQGLVKAGAPLRELPTRDANFLGGFGVTVAHLQQSPHPNAARVFMNWYLSKDATTLMSRLADMQTAREDIPTGHLAPDELRDPSVKYYMDNEELLLRQQSEYKLVMEIFGPLVK